jgi:hypothetical protein
MTGIKVIGFLQKDRKKSNFKQYLDAICVVVTLTHVILSNLK